jgi:hypothetical protein
MREMENAARSACPPDEVLEQLLHAEPGRAPDELARHVAGCERCQQRVLFGSAPRPARKRSAPQWPTPQRVLVWTAAVLVAFVMLLFSLHRLATLGR